MIDNTRPDRCKTVLSDPVRSGNWPDWTFYYGLILMPDHAKQENAKKQTF